MRDPIRCPVSTDECSEKWRQHHLGDDPCTKEDMKNCLKWNSASPSEQIKILERIIKKLGS
jgi:hypothetical protein